MPKVVARSLKDVTKHPYAAKILDRRQDVIPMAEEMVEDWSYDLYSRKPGPAVTEDGTFVGTDLDLACFLSALVDRGAVINIPHYEARRGATKKEGERVVSDKNRHGQVMGLTANKNVFSFSIRIKDMNVVTQDQRTGKEEVGAPRNFMLVDINGDWYDGWKRIEFSPTAKENAFLEDKRLWTGPTVVFKNFVHPNRWQSFFGQYYLLTKALIARLDDQCAHLKSEISRLEALGIPMPSDPTRTTTGAFPGYDDDDEGPKTSRGPTKSEKVPAFDAVVHIGEFQEEYPFIVTSPDALKEAKDLLKLWRYTTLPLLRFATRSVELAFFRHGADGDKPLMESKDGKTRPERMPSWIEGAEWERDFSFPGERRKYSRLILGQPAVGQMGLSIAYRIYEKSERVAI